MQLCRGHMLRHSSLLHTCRRHVPQPSTPIHTPVDVMCPLHTPRDNPLHACRWQVPPHNSWRHTCK